MTTVDTMKEIREALYGAHKYWCVNIADCMMDEESDSPYLKQVTKLDALIKESEKQAVFDDAATRGAGFMKEAKHIPFDDVFLPPKNPLAFLDKPETVEEVAKALNEVDVGKEYPIIINEAPCLKLAQAAISTIKRLAGERG